jgi:phage-related protein
VKPWKGDGGRRRRRIVEEKSKPAPFAKGAKGAAEGGKADIAKPLHGLGSGVFEIALRFKGDAFRVVYGVQFAEDIWVVHAFQKKSTQGIKTPRREIDLIKDRLKRLKEMLG